MATSTALSPAAALTIVALACGCSPSRSGFAADGGSGDFGSFPDGGGGGGSSVCEPNPANYDIPGNDCDDDGDGKVDNTIVCDGNLPASGTARDFASAIGLCQDAGAGKWGIISAELTNGYGPGIPAVGQHAILPHFGSVIRPREGSRLAVLSSGYAFQCDDGNPGAGCAGNGESDPYFKGEQVGMTGLGTAPPGYPKPASGCQNASDVYDAIGVKLQVLVPANAQGLQFDFDFYSGEWPEYVCTKYNDSFVAWLTSSAYVGNDGDLNISFDGSGNPVSVNNAFFDRCTTNTVTGCAGGPAGTAACAGGPSELAGTGFYDLATYCGAVSTGGGATGWLTTKAPVKQAETITLQFIIWDTGDQSWDSSVLVDNFQWQPGPTHTGTGRPAQ
jgi:hypothetical protein